MTTIKQHLETLKTVERKKHHPLLHKLHKKYNLSKRTLFYVKEYGPHTNVAKTILRESLKIMLFASVLSSLGGFALENIKTVFISILPLIILLPTLNNMIGSYGTIISSKFSTMLLTGKVHKSWWKYPPLIKLFIQIFIIATITALLSAVIASGALYFIKSYIDFSIVGKVLLMVIADVIIIVSTLMLIATFAGLYFYKKKEDPNNFLIPLTTSIADFGNILILSALTVLFF